MLAARGTKLVKVSLRLPRAQEQQLRAGKAISRCLSACAGSPPRRDMEDDVLGFGETFAESCDYEEEEFRFHPESGSSGDPLSEPTDRRMAVIVRIRMLPREQCHTAPTALTLWPAARLLASHIVTHGTEWKNQCVLELGCGVGLCGIVMAKYARHVILSDGDSKCLDLVRENCIRNGVGSTTSCALVAWGSPPELPAMAAANVDLVIGSDLIYSPESLAPLFQTAAAFPRFLMTYIRRSFIKDEDVFATAGKHGFQCHSHLQFDNVIPRCHLLDFRRSVSQ